MHDSSNFVTQAVPIGIRDEQPPKLKKAKSKIPEVEMQKSYSAFNMNLEDQTKQYILWRKEHVVKP